MKKMIKPLAITVLIVVLVAGFAGYLSSGFTSTMPTIAIEGAPKMDVAEALQVEGWQLHYRNGENAEQGYDGIRAVFSIDADAIRTYEEQGYKVELGIVYGIGMNNDTGVRYNNVKQLAVVSKNGKTAAKRTHTEVSVAYATDESVEQTGFFENWSFGSDDRRAFLVQTDLDPNDPNANTYVAAAFIRLTGSTGTTTEYCYLREVMSVKPLVLGAMIEN